MFSAAERVVVTTETMAADVAARIPRAAPRTTIIPNYVETDRFRPQSEGRHDADLIYVGRLSPEKNLEALLQAVQGLGLTMLIIGDGILRTPLESRFGTMDGRLRWLGTVANGELPRWLNRARLFALPSQYEGHPKTLLEAMACGLPVLGANSPGIREIIRHDRNGWLCGTSTAEIAAAIEVLLADPERRARLGASARQFAIHNYEISRIVEKELTLYDEVAGIHA